MDLGRSVFPEYIKGDGKFKPFNPDVPRTGSHYAIADALGGDKIPVCPKCDYTKMDTDLIYLWLQGGCTRHGHPCMEALKKMRASTDAVILINWEEAYWLDDYYSMRTLELHQESAKYADAVCSGFIGDGNRMKRLGVDVTWRYNVTPYDIDWLKYHFSKMPKDSPRRIYSMVHGRSLWGGRWAQMAVETMRELRGLYPFDLEFILNRYRFLQSADAYNLVRSVGAENIVKIVGAMEPWIKYMEYLAKSYIYIDDYPAYSQSHTTLEAACAGVPTVSHKHNSSAVVCFPELLCPINDRISWLKKTDRLIDDEIFYSKTREHGLKAVEHYGFENFYDQLKQIWRELKR